MLLLRQLEIFRAVMTTGSLTAAGQRLQMSQPAVSKAIRRMEDQLGFQLFHRGEGRVRPTNEAAKLIREVDKVFHSVGVVERYARDLKESHVGVLTLACTPTMSCSFLPGAIRNFQKVHPNVHIWLQTTKTNEAIELAATGQIDLGFIYAPADHPLIASTQLFESELVCVMRRDHPLAEKPEIQLADLEGEPIISNVRNEWLYGLLGGMMSPNSLERSVTISSNSTITACSLVQAGCGVALVEPMGVADLFPDTVQRPLTPRAPIYPRAIYRASEPLSRIAEGFLKALQHEIEISQA